MNLRLLLALTVLFLSACGTRTVRDDLPASDLLALKANAERNLRPRLLPNGKTYCAELAKKESEKDNCTGDLEDTYFLSEQDKSRGLSSILKGIERLMLQRNPCGWWSRTFQKEKCLVQ